MIATIQKQATKMIDTELPSGVVLDENGIPVDSISAEEWFHILGTMLNSHFGEGFSTRWNEAFTEPNMKLDV